MRFEWDEAKNQSNIAKHGIGFVQAQAIFDGPVLTHVDRRHSYGETRFISVGQVAETVVIVVVHTDRDGVTRIISARRANRKERTRYDQIVRQALDR